MPDDPNDVAPEPTTPDPPPAEPTPPDPGERMFTQEEVGRLVAQERKRARETALKEAQPAPKPKPNGTPKRKDAGDYEQRIADLEARYRFASVAADHGLPAKQREKLESMFVADAPEDPGAWLADMVETFGLGAQPQPSQPKAEDAPTNDPPAPRAPPTTDRGGPSSPPDSIRVEHPLRWDQSDVDRIIDEKGNFWDGAQEVRKRFMAGLRGISLEFPRGPK